MFMLSVYNRLPKPIDEMTPFEFLDFVLGKARSLGTKDCTAFEDVAFVMVANRRCFARRYRKWSKGETVDGLTFAKHLKDIRHIFREVHFCDVYAYLVSKDEGHNFGDNFLYRCMGFVKELKDCDLEGGRVCELNGTLLAVQPISKLKHD